MTSTRSIRLAGVAAAASAAFYVPWFVAHLDLGAAWLSIPFALANLLLALGVGLAVVNNWSRAVPDRHPVAPGDEPMVAVIVPTAGEPSDQVRRTVESVLDGDWPDDRLRIVVSDDAHADDIRTVVERIAADRPRASIAYFRPPPRGSALRHGDAKAGNLNAALALTGGAAYVETRDADDEVGDRAFLREAVGQLVADPGVAFVQTVKESRTSPGDPFDNAQAHFFRGAMHARHASNAVFPCGSGLVWRRAALHDIGNFPTWNVVEDLESGIEALRRGWRGVYLPVVGALAQHAPEDIPVTYKQRGTWALDTMRLLIWRRLRGLSIRQRLHFYELGLFYLQSFATLVFVLSPPLGFVFDAYPLQTDLTDYLLHFWPFAVAVELVLAALNRPRPYETLWRARIMWAGLLFVYMRGCVLAVLGGPHRKPAYVVTRKQHAHGLYLREVAPQAVLVAVLLGSMAYALATSSFLRGFDLGSAYFAMLYVLLLGGFVRLAWHGVRPAVTARLVRTAAAGFAALAASGFVAVLLASGADPRPVALAAAGAGVVLSVGSGIARGGALAISPGWALASGGAFAAGALLLVA